MMKFRVVALAGDAQKLPSRAAPPPLVMPGVEPGIPGAACGDCPRTAARVHGA